MKVYMIYVRDENFYALLPEKLNRLMPDNTRVKVMALPPLGTGAGNLGAEEAAEAMVPLIQDHLRRFQHPREVVITVSNDYENDVFLRAVELAGGQASAQES